MVFPDNGVDLFIGNYVFSVNEIKRWSNCLDIFNYININLVKIDKYSIRDTFVKIRLYIYIIVKS